jgi:hypothetical protein
VDSLEVDRSSELDPDGRDTVGAVRAFRTGRMVTGERLTGLDEEKRMTYEDAFNPLMNRTMKRVMQQMAEGLASHAET